MQLSKPFLFKNRSLSYALIQISQLRGASKKKITDEEYERARREVCLEIKIV